MEQLNEIVGLWEKGEVDTAALKYSALFDKMEIREELVHLKNMLNKQNKEDREKWIRCFQELFEDIMKNGLALEEQPWFKVGISKENKRFAHTDYLRKSKLIAVCQIQLLKEVYEEKIKVIYE